MNVNKTLTRGVSEILPSKKGLGVLMKKKKITLYQGFDPSSSSLHIGHLIGIRKLAQFQKLGHRVIFLIGDFTGMIGDPTDKTAARKKLSHKQVLKNAKNWRKQIDKIISFTGQNKAQILYNSKWLSKMSFEDVIELASNITVQQLLERDFFRQRLKNNKPIHLHEFLYPLMQGYDSVFMNVDLEIGGNDQLFNMMAGRTLMKILKQKEKFVLSMKLLEDSSGNKMGKTEGNAVNLTDKPNDIFGKIMSVPDSMVDLGIELLTNLPLNLSKKEGAMNAKKQLSFEVVKQIHGEGKASSAQNHFEKTFQKKDPSFEKTTPFKNLLEEVVSSQVKSKSEAKRLIFQNSVKVNGIVITNPKHEMKGGERIKIGKKIFVKVNKN